MKPNTGSFTFFLVEGFLVAFSIRSIFSMGLFQLILNPVEVSAMLPAIAENFHGKACTRTLHYVQEGLTRID